MHSSTSICVDASLVVPLVADPRDSEIRSLWQRWAEQRRELAAPSLIYFEVANALYRSWKLGRLSPAAAVTALESALALPLRLYRDASLHLDALRLARDFALPACYDAHYLALAERLGADFWTCDRRLANAVAQRLPWVHLAAEGR